MSETHRQASRDRCMFKGVGVLDRQTGGRGVREMRENNSDSVNDVVNGMQRDNYIVIGVCWFTDAADA